ncbi:MAG: Phospholipase precursor [Pseudomonadota bacterium]|jgi:alkaline phosphatase D
MGLTRRRFLGRAPLGLLTCLPACAGSDEAPAVFPLTSNPFAHGIASGDPLADAVILWTRVTPPEAPSGAEPVEQQVQWRIALEPGLSQVIAQGSATTSAALDYTVKVDVRDLSPATTYYYEFSVLGVRSSVGRTRTLPRGPVERARIGVVCCANYPAGFFNAYRLVAERADLDFVLHLGDYLYEYGNGTFGDGAAIDRVPSPDREAVTLEEYRQRHAQYKTDPDLQEAHRQHPFIAIWDDHEVANNAYREGAANHQPDTEGDWAVRRAAAMRAYFEWMPIRAPEPGNTQRVYRSFSYGNLLDLLLLDTRHERDQHVSSNCDAVTLAEPSRTMLGAEQEQWLLAALTASQGRGARWRLVGQQVMFAQLSDLAQGCVTQLDQWDGYPAARDRVLTALQGGVDNVVLLTGDAHSSWAFDIADDPFDPARYTAATGEGSVAVEFVAPGVTSPGPTGQVQAMLDSHPHLKFVDLDRRGYLLLDLTAERAQAEWYFMLSVAEPLGREELGAIYRTGQGQNRLSAGDVASSPRADAPALAP